MSAGPLAVSFGPMKKRYLIDLSSLIFRAFYAVRPLHSSDGTPVNAVYGVLSMILRLVKEEKTNHLIFCQDQKEPSFRKEIYSEYKAHRTEMPEDLVPQMAIIEQLIDALGFAKVGKVGYEADDVIGTLAVDFAKTGGEVFIVSGDKDFGQLVSPQIKLYDTMKNVRLGEAEVLQKWEVRPEQFIDYLALMGDSSDNVPGVKGIGPKTAVTLLKQFGSLDGIYENINQIEKVGVKTKLIEDLEMAYLSKKLVTITTDIPSLEQEPLEFSGIRSAELIQLLDQLNFKSSQKAIEDLVKNGLLFYSGQSANSQLESKMASSTESQSSVEGQTLKADDLVKSPTITFEVIEMSLSHIKSLQLTSDHLWIAEAGSQVFLCEGEKIYVLSEERLEILNYLVEKGVRLKGFDLKALAKKYSFKDLKIATDLMLGLYLLHPGEKLDLTLLAPRLTGMSLSELPTAQETMNLYLALEAALVTTLTEQNSLSLWQDLENPVAEILFKMEQTGFAIDLDALKVMSDSLAVDLKETTEKIYQAAGVEFNIASPKQLGPILFERLQLPASKKTKTGYSTDSDVLESLQGSHPIVPLILQFREWSKLKSTYVDSIPRLVDENHRVHSVFHQALTSTGRLSSTDPNLQNIPIRTERGSQIRKAFIAGPGHELLSADYSQIELRILAHVADDPNMIRAFADGLDIHQATASEVFSTPLAQVTSEQRRVAKAVNFGIAYGQGAFGLAENLKISRGEASEIIKNYFARFSKVQDYFTSTLEMGRQKNFVETLLGRRRYLPDLNSKNGAVRKFAERAAINAPIQGTAADIVKLAMIKVASLNDIRLVLQVHDELIFEGTREALLSRQNEVNRLMQSVVTLKVPLIVNSVVARNWFQAH